ncbi:hypothetical protein GOBAR_AA14650 [Gossypium barbadense]|uniref:Potassium transporter n=1 Tax=Gossypium barbadense TaxID=3634 RepID=A0A2P5XRM8_GOSBA|nr:hypothetical protein GOBAR_AA14650 [Gossypium barbadense]
MDLETGVYQNYAKKESWRTVLILAYQSLGVVYGDLSTSPLYVYKSTFEEDIQHSETNEEIYGVLSFVFWTLTLVPLLKYVFIVLRADDNGEGGTFALYSLLCRHARVNSLPNCQLADEELIEYKKDSIGLAPQSSFGSSLKSSLEKHRVLQRFLLVLALIGTCMVIGDGILTPAISVFSAVSGLELSMSKEHHKCSTNFADVEVPVACIILIGLFALQHYGTHRIAFTFLVYPSLILAYMGQAAYLSQHHIIESEFSANCNYQNVIASEKLRWPVLVIAILAAVVGSQAIITGTFSIIKQCSSLGCFPRVKIIHTSSKIHGQIYIPEINWLLMVLCLAVTVGFRDTRRMGNASGLEFIKWQGQVLEIEKKGTDMRFGCYNCDAGHYLPDVFALYFTASLTKFLEGAWVPIALAFIFLIIMCVWHYGTLKKYEFDVQNKVSINWLLSLGPSLGIVRVRGIGLVHTELVSGIPAIFSHFVTNLPAFHQVLVFLCIKSVPVPHVKPEERFLIGHIGPREYRLYRCIVRYGYRDVHKDDMEFEKDLVCSIAEFIQSESVAPGSVNEDLVKDDDKMTVVGTCSSHTEGVQMREDDADKIEAAGPSELKEIWSPPPVIKLRKRVRFIVPKSPEIDTGAREELQELMEAREAGIAYILGHSYVKAKQGSSLIKKLVINYGYEFLRRNSRLSTYALSVPHASTLEVGMIYHV